MTASRHSGEAHPSQGPGQVLPPGPARDLVDRFRMLRLRRPLSVRQIAGRAGLSAGYVSEILNGMKAPRSDAAARIAQALGADERAVLEVRRLSEALGELRRFQRRAERALRQEAAAVPQGADPHTAAGPPPTSAPSADGAAGGAGGAGSPPPARDAGHGSSASDLERQARTHAAQVDDLRRPVQAGSQRYAIAGTDGPRRCIAAVAGSLYRSRGADIWVNSENTDMMMARPSEFSISAIIRYWGARRDGSGRIVDDVIADELAERVRHHPSVAPGTALVTGSGALAESHGVRHVIHVASVAGEPAAGFRQVYNIAACVTNVLAQAERVAAADPAVRTVLFPLLGVGTGGGHVRSTVMTMVDTAVHFLADRPRTPLTEVQLLGFNVREWEALTAVLAGDERLVRVTA
ncbi:helix-turn-helix domain-containing protein [Streptomyces sp. NPDC020983]|uniref:helix-turn-helix domain-containing protein n=1 Tax=Streptomyces sp. NPDC020983 TaxID=3365106 RepID=UPI0037B3CFAE